MSPRPPAPRYLGPARFHGPSTNKPIRRIVIHCTVSPCAPGGARSIAAYFRSTVKRPSSAHYVVDPLEAVQVVYDSVVAYHAPPNTGSLGVELCDPQAGNPLRWLDLNHRRMLSRSARLVAQLCLAYDVPIEHLTVAQLRAGRHGIVGHVDVSNAWHETSHTDPGAGFPWRGFLRRVRTWAKRLEAEQAAA